MRRERFNNVPYRQYVPYLIFDTFRETCPLKPRGRVPYALWQLPISPRIYYTTWTFDLLTCVPVITTSEGVSESVQYIYYYNGSIWLPDGDDIVDELLASLIIQDAETDETKFDKSHILNKIIGTNTDGDGREDKLPKWSTYVEVELLAYDSYLHCICSLTTWIILFWNCLHRTP